MGGLGIADDCGEDAGFQRFLHEPEQAGRLFQGDGDQAVADEAQALEAMAIEPAVLALGPGKATPEQRPAFRWIIETA